MSAFTVEDQERQRKMNKMTDGKMLKNDTWGCAKDLGRSFGTLFILLYFSNLSQQSLYNIVGYSTDNFLNE